MSHQSGARYTTESELRKKGFINADRGIFFGYHNGHALHQPIDTYDGSAVITAGAGAGKSACVNIINELTNCMGCNTLSLDVRGDVTAITTLSTSLAGYELYSFNPKGLNNLPQHTTNPLGHLTRDNRDLIEDTKLCVEDLIPKTNGTKWWVDAAHDLVVHLILHLVISRGSVSLVSLYRAYQNILEDEAWDTLSHEMQHSPMQDIRAMADTWIKRKDDGRDSYTAPLGVIQDTLSFMQVPDFARAVSGSETDFSLSDICSTGKKVKIALVIEAKHLKMCAALIRLMLSRVVQAKLKVGGSEKIGIIIDEAKTIGFSPTALELFSLLRGQNIVGVLYFQETGQILDLYGKNGTDEMLGSARTQVFAQARRPTSIENIQALGGECDAEDVLARNAQEGQFSRDYAAQQLFGGANLMDVQAQYQHHGLMRDMPKKSKKPLIEKHEILYGQDVFAFVAGAGLGGAIRLDWTRYFERPELAGKYLCSPLHNPTHVTITDRFGRKKQARMITERCPPALLHLPQYRGSGQWQYIEGYKPNIGASAEPEQRAKPKLLVAKPKAASSWGKTGMFSKSSAKGWGKF